MNEAVKDLTPSGKIKRPSYSLIENWIKESWDSINPNMIRRSFKCCGISNSLDGTEDNLIFDFNKVEKVNNQRRGIEEDDESGLDDDNKSSESEDDYYKENENCNVIQDWN